MVLPNPQGEAQLLQLDARAAIRRGPPCSALHLAEPSGSGSVFHADRPSRPSLYIGSGPRCGVSDVMALLDPHHGRSQLL